MLQTFEITLTFRLINLFIISASEENQSPPPAKRSVKQPASLNSSVVSCSLGHCEYTSVQVLSDSNQDPEVQDNEQTRKWARTLYYPILDTLIAECTRRFSSTSMQIARGMAAVLNINFEGTEALITQYFNLLSINPELVTAEMNLLRVMIPDGQLSSTMMARVKEQLLKGLYPNFCKLYRLALCMPVGTASCKRSFSAMRRI